MNTTTNTRGVEIPGLIGMSDLLRKRGVETRSFRDHEIAEAAFRAGLEAAQSITAPSGGVSEAMVERFKAAFAEHSTISPGYDGCIRAALEAALSAPEPAVQGRGEAVYQCMCTDPNIDEDGNKHEDDGRVWMDVSEDNYVALSKRPDVRARIVYTHPAPPASPAAPSAQPAERVPGAYVMDSGFKYESVGKHIPTVLVGFAPDDFDARDRFAAMLTATPAPSEGGKGVEG